MKHSVVVAAEALNASEGSSIVVPLSGGSYVRFGKRVFDVALAIAALPILVPVIALLWLIARASGGPGFFGHRRVGKDGAMFVCWKIRTMVPSAEARLLEHLSTNPAAAAEWARDMKLTDDPRITPIGHFLRRTSLDELPQIWNVLRGEMSFVGPRPVLPVELDRYGASSWAYLRQRPGVTGLWQVSGRNSLAYDERVALDVSYSQRVNIWFDIRILIKTVDVVLGRNGR